VTPPKVGVISVISCIVRASCMLSVTQAVTGTIQSSHYIQTFFARNQQVIVTLTFMFSTFVSFGTEILRRKPT